MYHQLTKTGRLVPVATVQAQRFQIASRALQRTETPKNESKTVIGTSRSYSTVPENIRQKQELFQKDNDVPVFLKGGPMDAVLYRLTLVLCVVGVIGVGDLIFSMSFPKKQ